MGTMPNKQIGSLGEKIAANYLIRQGYRLVGLNVSNRLGEIDIISRKPDGSMCFVEIKTVLAPRRKRIFNFDPVDKLSPGKIQRLNQAIHYHIRQYNIEENWQLDAVIVYFDQDNNQAECRHLEYISLDW